MVHPHHDPTLGVSRIAHPGWHTGNTNSHCTPKSDAAMNLLFRLRRCTLWLLATPLWAWAAPNGPLPMETGFEPQTAVTVWPLKISEGYPLVHASVGGVTGVLLFDTGTPWGLLLNRARVKLPDSSFVLRAQAGSGQAFDVFRSSAMPPLHIHGQTWADVAQVHSADMGFIEDGTDLGPLLGFVGAHFVKDSELTLDYARQLLVVRQTDSATGKPLGELPSALQPGQTLATHTYQGSHSFPLFDTTLNGQAVRVMLDSGNPSASITAPWLTHEMQAKRVTLFGQSQGQPTHRLGQLRIGPRDFPLNNATSYTPSPQVNGQPDDKVVKVGFALLNQLGVRWNHRLRSMDFFVP